MLLFFLLVGDFSILPKLLIPLLVVMVGGAATSIYPISIESGDFIVQCVGKDAFGTGLFISLIVQLGREMNKAWHQPTYNFHLRLAKMGEIVDNCLLNSITLRPAGYRYTDRRFSLGNTPKVLYHDVLFTH